MSIRAIVMDVDGTLTDGGIYLDDRGNEFKKFDVKDGYAIHDILPSMNIIPIILTGRKSEIVKRRSQELGIQYVIQGSKNKIEDMKDILSKLSISLEDTVYIGYDLNDLECMKMVGISACPNDAVDEIKKICKYIAKKNAGSGAVREIVEWVMCIQERERERQ